MGDLEAGVRVRVATGVEDDVASAGACHAGEFFQVRCRVGHGVRLNVAALGDGPLVLLCHGFPESWYSWRHQLTALAAAGFHAVAPDMRGYGRSDAPPAIDQYTMFHLVGDMVGVLDALEVDTAVIAVMFRALRLALAVDSPFFVGRMPLTWPSGARR